MNYAPCTAATGTLALLMLVGSVARAEAGPAVVVLDANLRPTAGRLVSISAEAVIVEPEGSAGAAGGGSVRTAMSAVRAVVPADWWMAETTAPMIAGPDAHRSVAERAGAGVCELSDGQRFVGRLMSAEGAAAEAINWESPALGRITIPLEHLSRVRMPGFGEPVALDADAAAKTDTLVLANGDVVLGYLEGVGTAVVFKTDAGESRVDPARVREIRLSNRAARAAGARVWLGDGSVVVVERLGVLAPPKTQPLLEVFLDAGDGTTARRGTTLEQFRAFAPASEAVVPLSGLEIARQAPAAGRFAGGAVRPIPEGDPLLGALDLELPGPMTVEWALPEGARVVAGWAVLPETARAWGACSLSLELVGPDGQAERLTHAELSRAHPTAELAAVLKGGGARRLRATLEAGPFGPIQDRVILRRVLIGRAVSAP